MGTLFGTDGIRGRAGEYPLDEPTLVRIGAALGEILGRETSSASVLLGRDTRESGPAVETALERGLASRGVAATLGGVLTTPAVAHIVRSEGFTAGIAISASHNPYHDNGIKVFASTGYKLSDADEGRVEALVLNGWEAEPLPASARRAPVTRDPEALRRSYLAALVGTVPAGRPLAGLEVVLDCGHGAASAVAPDVFAAAGASVCTIGNTPDGRNINEGCGALHPEQLAREVLARGAQLGAAFDGDADRAIFVDEAGTIRDGDDVLAVFASHLMRSGSAERREVVGTIMSNIGLALTLERSGMSLVRTKVGDKYVLEAMRERGALFGGEPSGHIILLEHATTGDGILTALKLASVMAATGQPLSRLAGNLVKAPQVLRNLRVARRARLEDYPEWVEALARVERALGSSGRAVVRFSGTEPLLRIMIEGPDRAEVERHALELSETAERLLR